MDTQTWICSLTALARNAGGAMLLERLATLDDETFGRVCDAAHPAMIIYPSLCREAAVRQMRSTDLPAAERAAAACRDIEAARDAYRREKAEAHPRAATLALIARCGRALASSAPAPAPDIIETMRAQLAGAKSTITTGGSEA
jgi:hypothetical protein